MRGVPKLATWIRTSRLVVAGQAEIWNVRNRDTGKTAVMKKLLRTPQLSDPDAELRRFQREIRSQMNMNHPGIMPIIGVNKSTENPFYVMPKADRSLQQLLESKPNGLGDDRAVGILLTIADAVQYAHGQGVIHRDLKPANVLEVYNDWVVADFGLCRDINSNSTTFTQANSIIGTVAYMAPEQFDAAHDANEAADVFALAKIFYHMLTGKVPFPYAPSDQVPARFRYIISKGMAEKPGDRYASVTEFAGQVQLVGGGPSLFEPADEARDLLNQALNGSRAATSQLTEVLISNSDDEAFYAEFVSQLPEPILAAIQESDTHAFDEIVTAFDGYSEGSHPFAYVDEIADFFARVFRIAREPMIRRRALNRIMVVGEYHNRFYVGGVFARLISSLSDPHDILLAVDVMNADRATARWYRGYLQENRKLPAVIRDLVESA